MELCRLTETDVMKDPAILSLLAIGLGLVLVSVVLGIIFGLNEMLPILITGTVLALFVVILALFIRRNRYGVYMEGDKLTVIASRTGFDRAVFILPIPTKVKEGKLKWRLVGLAGSKLKLGSFTVNGVTLPAFSVNGRKVYILDQKVAVYCPPLDELIDKIKG